VRFEDEPVAVLLVSAPEAAESTARRILDPVLDLPDDDRAVTIDTARVWIASARSASTAAPAPQYCSLPATRLEELANRSLGNPLDLAELQLTLECARMLGVA
jgi:hypothetical protein